MEESVYKAQPVALPPGVKLPETKTPEIDPKQYALDGILEIGVNLGHSRKQFLNARLMGILYRNTRKSLLLYDNMKMSREASREYAKERRANVKIPSSWRAYAMTVDGAKLVSLDDVYLIDAERITAMACSLGIFPFTIDTRPSTGTAFLRAEVRGALESILSPPSVRVATIKGPASMSQFYDMKKNETLDDLRIIDPSIPEGMCPLMSKYKLGTYLGGGTYGVVLKVSAGSSTSKLGYDEYALKIQYMSDADETDSISTAYQELRATDLIMQGLPTVNIGALWCNVVKLYDWVKCSMDLEKKLLSLPGDYSKVFVRNREEREGFRGVHTYQFMISEFCDGDCYSYFRNHGYLAFQASFMSSFLVQILCSLSQLQEWIRGTHYDLHLLNILYQQVRGSPTYNQYLHYEIRGQHLYVLLFESGDMIFKLSDFGMTYAQFYVGDDPVPKVISGGSWYQPPEGRADKFNPRFDMHELGCSILERLFYAVRIEEVDPNDLDKQMIIVLELLIHSQWKTEDNKKRYAKVAAAIATVEGAMAAHDTTAYMAQEDVLDKLSDGEDAALELRSQIFTSDEEPSSWIASVLKYRFFDSHRNKPPSSAQVIDMDLRGKP